ncbi:MAG: aminotransferase class I/II-fold pyridoxal phosphate-dependent enzyme, partial [Candidatus Hydrogenedentes bacterium]|nr:aminotransferase class I/II-fold pyridoxal phosphate-dependent enzyme [Candidatus Hydrogenedentota bacterium]
MLLFQYRRASNFRHARSSCGTYKTNYGYVYKAWQKNCRRKIILLGGNTVEDSYIQGLFADRIGGIGFGKDTTIYKFEKIKRAKRQAVAANPGVPIIDFGIGESDDVANEIIRAKLKQEVDKFDNRTYADNGIPEFKQAAAQYMKKVFGVTLDPDTEICHCIGSKPALAMLPLTLINPGDIAFMTVPGYPVFGTHTRYLGGEVVN